MNIYLRELKASRKSLIIWGVSIILLIAMGMGKYTAVGTSDQSLNDMMKSMPKSMQAIIGGGAFDLTTVIGFYAVLFLYLVLMTSIHAVMLGSGIIGKEESDKTAEFLMVKPVSRYTIITSKLLAALTNVVIINLITFLFSIVMTNYYNDGESIVFDIFRLMLGIFLLQLFFMSLGAFVSSYKYTRATSGISSGILLLTFFLSVIIDMSENLDFLKYLTPFKYFDAKTLLVGEGFNIFLVLLTLLLTGLFTYFTYINYNKRDLHI